MPGYGHAKIHGPPRRPSEIPPRAQLSRFAFEQTSRGAQLSPSEGPVKSPCPGKVCSKAKRLNWARGGISEGRLGGLLISPTVSPSSLGRKSGGNLKHTTSRYNIPRGTPPHTHRVETQHHQAQKDIGTPSARRCQPRANPRTPLENQPRRLDPKQFVTLALNLKALGPDSQPKRTKHKG